MVVLLDPSCENARRLEAAHAREMRAMVEDPTSRLGQILVERHSRERTAHFLTCAGCYGYEPPCQHCGRDLRKSAHGWLCKAKESRWGDLMPARWPAFAKPQPPARPVGPPPGVPPSLQPPTERRAKPAPSPRRTQPPKVRTVPVQEPPQPKKPAPAPAAAPAAAPASPPRAKAAPPPPPPPSPKKKQAPSPPPPPPPPKQQEASPPPVPPRQSAPDKPDPYAILGLPAGASLSDVRKAFREKAQQYHPDKVMHLAPEFREIAETRMRQLNEAYQELREKLKAAEASA